MGDPFRVRPARPSDRAGMVAVERASFAAPWERESFTVQPPWMFFVAEMEGEVIGFAIGRRAADEGEVLNVAVLPERRGQGVGRRLLEKLIAKMEAEGVKSVFLEVRESNLLARSLYGILGFEIVGLRPGYYSDPPENALQMKVILGL